MHYAYMSDRSTVKSSYTRRKSSSVVVCMTLRKGGGEGGLKGHYDVKRTNFSLEMPPNYALLFIISSACLNFLMKLN